MGRLGIAVFLEDLAQDGLIKAFIARTAETVGAAVGAIELRVYNASGGRGSVMTELRRFLQHLERGTVPPAPILIVAIDGNCQSHATRSREIRDIVSNHHYPGYLVCAVPDPHIERWYMADPLALQRVTESPALVIPPEYKCERSRYKNALRDAFRQGGVIPPFGGVEYATDIVAEMDLLAACRNDPSLRQFLSDLRAALSAHHG
jgi:hypothetical protein